MTTTTDYAPGTGNPELPCMLVVDDDVIQRSIIARIGSQAGFEVIGASTVDEAAGRLGSRRFDCVTLDLSLGEQSGTSLLRTMIETGNHAPVFVISGADQRILDEIRQIATTLGLNARSFAKPLKFVELRQALQFEHENVVLRRGVADLTRSSKPAVLA